MNAGMDKGVRVATEYENGNAKDIGKERLKIPARLFKRQRKS